jgi:hypothetical protein
MRPSKNNPLIRPVGHLLPLEGGEGTFGFLFADFVDLSIEILWF